MTASCSGFQVRDAAFLARTHLCMRTLGGELDAKGHLDALSEIHRILVDEGQWP